MKYSRRISLDSVGSEQGVTACVTALHASSLLRSLSVFAQLSTSVSIVFARSRHSLYLARTLLRLALVIWEVFLTTMEHGFPTCPRSSSLPNLVRNAT